MCKSSASVNRLLFFLRLWKWGFSAQTYFSNCEKLGTFSFLIFLNFRLGQGKTRDFEVSHRGKKITGGDEKGVQCKWQREDKQSTGDFSTILNNLSRSWSLFEYLNSNLKRISFMEKLQDHLGCWTLIWLSVPSYLYQSFIVCTHTFDHTSKC